MKSDFLRRYTDLPSLLYLLRRKKLTLLNPESWDDKNDSHHINLYKVRKNLSTVLALCLTEKGETYHHWKIFAPGPSGVCIKFNKQQLLKHLSEFSGVRFGAVQYAMMDHLRTTAPALDDLPFLKRYAFQDEREFRIIYEWAKSEIESKDFIIPLSCISKISLSPWNHASLTPAIKETIKSIDGCESLRIGRSSLINNKEWKRIGTDATKLITTYNKAQTSNR